MTRRKRINCAAEQRREIWDRWKRGQTAHDIGRAFDRFHTSAYRILAETGGIRPPERDGEFPCFDAQGVVFEPIPRYSNLSWETNRTGG